MNNQLDELVSYVRQQLYQGVTEEQIRQALLQSNWSNESVNHAFGQAVQSLQNQNTATATSLQFDAQIRKKKTRIGVLWILSPLIVFIATLFLNIILRISGISSPLFNVISILAGVAGAILIFVGPITGTIILAKRK